MKTTFTDLPLSTGAMTGPYRRTRPMTLTLRQRIERWVRRQLQGL